MRYLNIGEGALAEADCLKETIQKKGASVICPRRNTVCQEKCHALKRLQRVASAR